MFMSEMEISMQQWPYTDFAHINVEYFRKPPKTDSAQKPEYLMVEAVFVPGSEVVMFFDHYATEYKRQKEELDAYLKKLGADGWKLTDAGGMVNGKGYQFRRYYFHRVKSS
jgi:hypothetical protein